ncbi:hypothetical protein [Prevotella sp. P6B4]|uniref:hypothetical protein n=1 Tax=Prevotella sp. P6B4 TaxID=1410614 RepID=UPI0009DCE2E1|nr:hypothetical protein [Prevotella sp. P6B4]
MACRPFALKDVRLLSSRFQRNMQRDSAWIASIPVNSLLHSFRNTAGVFSSKEGGYMTMKHLAELDAAYSIVFPASTPINVNKKARRISAPC